MMYDMYQNLNSSIKNIENNDKVNKKLMKI
jgi:hypothetical protein